MNEDINEVNVLDELNKGACMGKDAIHFILDKVEDDALRDELNTQYDKYSQYQTEYTKFTQNIAITSHTKQMP